MQVGINIFFINVNYMQTKWKYVPVSYSSLIPLNIWQLPIFSKKKKEVNTYFVNFSQVKALVFAFEFFLQMQINVMDVEVRLFMRPMF